MAAKISLKLTNRAPKKGFRNLPSQIELSADATVEDAKKAIAAASGVKDFNRVGLFDPESKKTLKNRKALVRDEQGVMAAGELLVKDLGTFLSTVFLCHC
jgi:hypothetical protein